MKNQRLFNSVALLITIISCTACRLRTPNLDSSQTYKNADNDYMQYASLEEIRNQLQNNLLNNKTNITFSTARIGTGNTMNSYEFEMKGIDLSDKEQNSSLKEIVNYLFGNSFNDNCVDFFSKNDPVIDGYPANDCPTDLNNDGLVERVNAFLVDILQYVPDSSNPSIGIYIHGTGKSFGSSVGFDENDYYWYMNYPTIEVFDILYDKHYCSAKYKMIDGEEWGVKEAVDFFEDFYNNKLASIDCESVDYKVEYIYVKQLENDRYGYLAKIITQDKNGNYIDGDSYKVGIEPQSVEKIASGAPFIFSENSFVYSWNKNKIGQYYKRSSIANLQQVSNNESLLNLDSALNVLSSYIGDKKVSFKSVELNYVQVCEGYPYFNLWNWDYETKGSVFYDVLCQDSCKFELKPMWVFKDSSSIEHCSDMYFVDATDGKVWIY